MATHKKKDGPKATESQRLYSSLKSAIVSMELPPGAGLDEAEIIRNYQVSRTPVREALIRLASEQLVTILPNRGASVSSLTFHDVVDHLEVMDILFPSVAYLCALRRTKDDMEGLSSAFDKIRTAFLRGDISEKVDAIFKFHSMVSSASHNKMLDTLYRQTLYPKLRVSRLGLMHAEGAALQDIKGHESALIESYGELIAYIELRDAEGAQGEASNLTEQVRLRLSSLLSSGVVKNLKLKFQ